MTTQQMIEVLQMYDHHLTGLGVLPQQRGEAREHILWMISCAREFALKPDPDKANRWLGFIQGVLWCEKIYTIDEMRGHNRAQGGNDAEE